MKSFNHLDEYIEAALETARYEKIENRTKVYAEIPAFRGVWANGRTRKQTKQELRRVLKGWIELQVERGQPLPAVCVHVIKIITIITYRKCKILRASLRRGMTAHSN